MDVTYVYKHPCLYKLCLLFINSRGGGGGGGGSFPNITSTYYDNPYIAPISILPQHYPHPSVWAGLGVSDSKAAGPLDKVRNPVKSASQLVQLRGEVFEHFRLGENTC